MCMAYTHEFTHGEFFSVPLLSVAGRQDSEVLTRHHMWAKHFSSAPYSRLKLVGSRELSSRRAEGKTEAESFAQSYIGRWSGVLVGVT